MKGPGLRTKLKTRREWRCPQTGKTLWLSGRQTQVVSPFVRGECFMQLVEQQIPPRVQPSLEEILEHMQIEPAPQVLETPPRAEAPLPSATQTADATDPVAE